MIIQCNKQEFRKMIIACNESSNCYECVLRSFCTELPNHEKGEFVADSSIIMEDET